MRAVTTRRTRGLAGLGALVLTSLIASGLPAWSADAGADPSATPSPSASAEETTGQSAAERRRERAAERKAAARKQADEAERAAADAEEAAREREEAAAVERAAERAAELAEQHAHDAAELVAASKELAAAQADLAVARTALTSARQQLRAARDADAAAQTDLDAAVLTEEKATRDLADVEVRIAEGHDDLGRLAQVAYKSNGSMGELSLVLSSTSPNQLAERLAFLQSVGSAGNAVIADLSVDRADLRNAQARLSATRRAAEEKRSAAAAALAAVGAKERLARSAEQQVDAVVTARQAAFDAAREAAVEDKRRYQVMVTQSGALGSRITELAATMRRAGTRSRGSGSFVLPGTGGVTSAFGPRLHPILNYVKVHTGTDLGIGDGVAYAADSGVVLLTEFNVAYGNMTVIDHGKVGGLRIATLYAHQSAIGVEPGDPVDKGQAIGIIGSTGYSTGPHLHFEVRVDGEPLDPTPFLEDAELPTRTFRAPR